MKFTIGKDAVLAGLQNVQSVIGARSTLPVLANVLLRAEGELLWMSTTDLEVSVRTGVAAKVARQGATTLPARRLFSIVRELPPGDIQVEVDDKDNATIRSGSSFFKIIGIPEREFPALPEFEGGRSFVLDQGVFREMLRSTSYSASNDETRYILNGVLVSFKNEKLTVVATDGRRLALIEQEVEFAKDSEVDFVVPSKTVEELVKTLGDAGPLKIQASANQAAFEFNHLLVVSKLIEGVYPNFRQVIPAQCEERVSIEREALQAAVRRVALLTNESSSSVRFLFTRNRLEISANTPEVGEARESLPVKYDGKEIGIAFNPDFVMAPLRCLSSDEVYFELTDELSPGVMKCDVPFLYVLMPMRVS